MRHIPVLLKEVLETLGAIRGKTIIDATFGAGGYSRAFLAAGARVMAFDRDPSVVPVKDKNFQLLRRPFSEISLFAPAPAIDAIVFDLGVSSMQIDRPERGFSFRFDGPLDMRMNQSATCKDAGGPAQSAKDLIDSLSEMELAEILRSYGDVKKAAPIARAMKEKLPQTTFALRDLIYNPKDIAPVFQALRIAVNDELGEIQRALDAVPALLAAGGICACVTFHSLEDRLVKRKFREWTAAVGDPRMPMPDESTLLAPPKFQLLKTFRPSPAELSANARARSAHLRAVRKKI